MEPEKCGKWEAHLVPKLRIKICDTPRDLRKVKKQTLSLQMSITYVSTGSSFTDANDLFSESNLLLSVTGPLATIAPSIGAPQVDGSLRVRHSVLESLFAGCSLFSPNCGAGMVACHHQLSVAALNRALGFVAPALLDIAPNSGALALEDCLRYSLQHSAEDPFLFTDADFIPTDQVQVIQPNANGVPATTAAAIANVAASFSASITIASLLSNINTAPNLSGVVFGWFCASFQGRGFVASCGLALETQVITPFASAICRFSDENIASSSFAKFASSVPRVFVGAALCSQHPVSSSPPSPPCSTAWPRT